MRLETRPTPGEHLDVLVRHLETGRASAVEPKYPTAALDVETGGEHFTLPHQGAQDIRGFDAVADIARIERFIAAGYADDGFAIVLSNDRSYWTDPAHGRETGAAAFRLYEGNVLTGERAWGPRSGPGTRRGREGSIDIAGHYTLHWHDYSDLHVPGGRLRTLTLPSESGVKTAL